eukprot:TRINITY_DN393_c0_g1_i2.p1 TRINITY_DN393_c0_g1~~TRINITY_DN393_c0_g1_i2.p1  ORF type:complete len:200 (-),score=24.20 TRINITY_DN393_c0_g1_i2:168-767(-)
MSQEQHLVDNIDDENDWEDEQSLIGSEDYDYDDFGGNFIGEGFNLIDLGFPFPLEEMKSSEKEDLNDENYVVKPFLGVPSAEVLEKRATVPEDERSCAICYEEIKHFYGLMSDCSHYFCYPCIVGWCFNSKMLKTNKRTCPTCKKTSKYVIPSQEIVKDVEKKKEMQQIYVNSIKIHQCAYYSKGLHCPKRSGCIFTHK